MTLNQYQLNIWVFNVGLEIGLYFLCVIILIF
jgi:hypothetical protein